MVNRNISPDLTVSDVIEEMTEEKLECLYYLMGKALNSKYKTPENLIKRNKDVILPKSHQKVKNVLYTFRVSEELVIIFLIKKAIEARDNNRGE